MGILVNDPNQGGGTGGAEVVQDLLLEASSIQIQAGWTDLGGGEFESNQASGNYGAIVWNDLPIEDGVLYLLRFFVEAKSAGAIATSLGTNASATAGPTALQWWGTDALSWSGYLHIKHTPSQPNTLAIRADNGFVGRISSISLVKIHGLPG